MSKPDEHYQRLVRDLLASAKAEARSWLQDSGGTNTLGELGSTEASLTLVNSIYAAGAEEVLAVEIDNYPGVGENTGKLLIKLPTEDARRKRVFAWHGDQARKHGFDGDEDVGQEYLFSMLD